MAPEGTGAVLRSTELQVLKAEKTKSYEEGFQAGINSAAEKDHLSLLVSEIFREWLANREFSRVIETLPVWDAIQAGVESAMRAALRNTVIRFPVDDMED